MNYRRIHGLLMASELFSFKDEKSWGLNVKDGI